MEFVDGRSFLRFLDGEIGHVLDDPLEVFRADRVEVGVGGGIHEVDGVGDSVFYGKFDGIEVVSQSFAERQ